MNFYCLKELDRAECKDATTAVAEKLLNSEISEEQLDAMDSEMLVSEPVSLDCVKGWGSILCSMNPSVKCFPSASRPRLV